MGRSLGKRPLPISETSSKSKSSLTSDPSDPRLTRGIDTEVVSQAAAYLVLSEEDRAKGFVRPVRTSYVHEECGTVTSMSMPIAETYARDPGFYGATYCVHCRMHLPVSKFTWVGEDIAVGS